MIFSLEQRFSTAQNLTATGASTNIIDLAATGTVLGAPAALVRDIGAGKPIEILVQQAADSAGTAETLVVTLETDDNAAFTSTKIVATAPTITANALDGDRVALFHVPPGTNERYLRLLYTLGGTNPDFTLDAGIVLADQTND